MQGFQAFASITQAREGSGLLTYPQEGLLTYISLMPTEPASSRNCYTAKRASLVAAAEKIVSHYGLNRHSPQPNLPN